MPAEFVAGEIVHWMKLRALRTDIIVGSVVEALYVRESVSTADMAFTEKG